MLEQSFGDWLKRKRKSLDLTQTELASQVGCSAAAIRKLEAEERRPSAQIAERLAEFFAIPQNERTNFLRFARGEMRFAAKMKEDFPWHTSTKSSRSNVPATVTSLVGREQELALVREYLLSRDIRLVSLVGPPGIGKTRLSTETARTILPDFPDGVFFVALAPLENESLLALTIAQALEYIETKRQPTIEQLIEGIGDKQMLIVLDNCEHLIDEVAALTSRLLSACSQLKILATSRESLRVPGEWLYAIPALNVPQEISSLDIETVSQFRALTLFAERARAVRSDFALDDNNIQTVVAICDQLDGLPLAIELIAARMRLMTPEALLERLNTQFVLDADGLRSTSTRQKTLNDAITWSYNLLSEGEKRLFAYLSVFAGGFTLEAAETIFSKEFVDTSISGLVTSLLDKSLLQRTFSRQARGKTRFNMLVTIQHFALNRLQNKRDERDARNWHVIYFLDLAQQADKEVRGPKQVEWLNRLGMERDNLRSALEWVIETRQTQTALLLTCRLDWVWFIRSDHNEARYWLRRVLALPDAATYSELYAEALTQLAHHTWLQTGPKEARPSVEQALLVARQIGDKWNTAKALAVLGLVLTDEGNFSEAESTLEDSKALFREVHDKWGYAHAVMCLTLPPYRQDDRTTALALYKQTRILFHELGDSYFEGVALRFISVLHLKEGKVIQGLAVLREALTLSRRLSSKYEIAVELEIAGMAAQAEGSFAHAIRLYSASENVMESIGAWPHPHDEFENNRAICRAALVESEFAAAEQEGRAMTMDQAIEYALEFSSGIITS